MFLTLLWIWPKSENINSIDVDDAGDCSRQTWKSTKSEITPLDFIAFHQVMGSMPSLAGSGDGDLSLFVAMGHSGISQASGNWYATPHSTYHSIWGDMLWQVADYYTSCTSHTLLQPPSQM